MKTTLYLTRHGQTEWNTAKKLQGHQDSPLTELGVNQAEWLGESLNHIEFDHIYSSSSPRAIRTAELIKGQKATKITPYDELREINLGVWEGRLQDELKESDAEQFHRFWNDPEHFGVEQSETFLDVQKRAMNKLNVILATNKGKTILVVTHTVIVKLIMAHFAGRALKDIWQPPYIHPTCLCKIELSDNGHEILLHGDISHYKEKADYV